MRRSTSSDVIGPFAENRLLCIELLSAVRGVYRLDKDKTVVVTHATTGATQWRKEKFGRR